MAEEAAAFLQAHLMGRSRVRVITHVDADGIAAAGILARCLHAYDVPFHIRFTSPLKPAEIMELGDEGYDLFVFVDQGSGQISAIEKFLLEKGCDVLILDHHPSELPKYKNLAYLNPHACGLNGAKDVSAAGVVYSLIERVDASFSPLVLYAIIGAVGDRQEFYSGFAGVNEMLLKRAIDLELLCTRTGLKLIGRWLPIAECLAMSIRPYLDGLSNELEACRSLVEELKIPPQATLEDLGEAFEEKLRDVILTRVGAAAACENFRHTLWGTIYKMMKEAVGPPNIHEQVAVLDACGKLGKPEVGFALTMGDRTAPSKALDILRAYQKKMMELLSWFAANPTFFKTGQQMRYILVDEKVDQSLLGEALALAMESGIVPTDYPVVGMVEVDATELKVSARATPDLAMRGINVGLAMVKAARAVGGEGGGHDVSAAARIPRDRVKEFITKLDQSLAEGDVDEPPTASTIEV
jgi:RecJ-like exonuclease